MLERTTMEKLRRDGLIWVQTADSFRADPGASSPIAIGRNQLNVQALPCIVS